MTDEPKARGRRTSLSPALWGYLSRLDQAGILDPSERTLDMELVTLDLAPGSLVLTDRRIVYYRSSFVRGRERALIIAYDEVLAVEVSEERAPIKRRGVLQLRFVRDSEESECRFEQIDGGITRARELGDLIERGRVPPSPGASLRAERGGGSIQRSEANSVSCAPTIRVGRGVTAFVCNRGGRLYVWGTPVGDFYRLKATTVQPVSAAFQRLDNFGDFELFVQDELIPLRYLRLTRRWLPKAGIAVDTGLVVGPSG